MPFASNAHTHCTWCDGKDTIPELLEAARNLGFVSLGLSSHAAQGFDFAYSMSEDRQHGYLAELRALQKSETSLRVWAGLELDALAHPRELELAREADYLIGSTHYVPAECDYAAVDGDPVRLRGFVEQHFAGDGLELARRYYQIESDFLLRQRPAIIGHFDLIRKHATRLGLFDEQAPAYRRLALNALERVYPCGAVLELNTGGMARGYLPTPYPTAELLGAWREMGGRVTLTSDCHNRLFLNYAFEEALALLRRTGYKSVLHLGTGADLWEEEAL